jgi:hypothetical protein
VMLVEADTGGEWKVGANAHEHSSQFRSLM